MLRPLRGFGGAFLALVRRSAYVAFALGSIVILGLAGCGRKGGLDPPPSAALPLSPPAAAQAAPAPAPAASAEALPASNAQAPVGMASIAPAAPPGQDPAKTGFDNEGNPVAGPGQKKSFFLDFLLQ